MQFRCLVQHRPIALAPNQPIPPLPPGALDVWPPVAKPPTHVAHEAPEGAGVVVGDEVGLACQRRPEAVGQQRLSGLQVRLRMGQEVRWVSGR